MIAPRYASARTAGRIERLALKTAVFARPGRAARKGVKIMATTRKRATAISVPALILENLGFLSFLGLLALLYIGNAHYAEYNVRRIQELEADIKEKRWLYMSLQSENMYNGLRSEVVDQVRPNGLRLHRGKPKKIYAPTVAK